MRRKVLIIGPSWVGDMVMAQSLFKVLKSEDPEVLIDVLAPAFTLPLLNRMSEVNEAHSMPIGHGQFALKTRYRIGKELRKKKYSHAIVLPNSFKSALIPWFAQIPIRTGWLGEARWWLLNDIRRLDEKKYPLMIERFMALGMPKDNPLNFKYPHPQLNVNQDELNATLTKFNILKSSAPILALCPGAEYGPAKRWPEEYFAEVANQKIKEGWTVWLFGSPKEAPLSDQIMKLTHQRVINFVGRTNLTEAIDLLSLVDVVISNDSGLMHVAAALGKKLVVMYGSTSAKFTPPLHHDVKMFSLSLSCQPCFARACPLQHHECMRKLTPHMILNAIQVTKATCEY